MLKDLERKLKIEKFNRFSQINMPIDYRFDIEDDEYPQVIFYFVKSKEDILELMNYSFDLPEDNRVIVIFEKGKKLRDELQPLRHNGFKMKAPMLCSIDERLSGFCLMKVRG